MAYTTTDLSNIESALAEGVLTVSVAGRTVTYRSLSEMMQIREIIRTELGQVDNGGTTFQTLKHDKGFQCSTT